MFFIIYMFNIVFLCFIFINKNNNFFIYMLGVESLILMFLMVLYPFFNFILFHVFLMMFVVSSVMMLTSIICGMFSSMNCNMKIFLK